jgi:hypothetical protein
VTVLSTDGVKGGEGVKGGDLTATTRHVRAMSAYPLIAEKLSGIVVSRFGPTRDISNNGETRYGAI